MADVLLLEDDPGLQFVLREALSGEGHVVYVASDNESAMNVLRRRTPDVLLLDLMIGGGLSTDVANYAVYSAPSAAVIFMTGSGLFPKGELFGMSRNARWVLRKPVDIGELTTMISHVTSDEVAQSLVHSR
ncbi:response regulator [Tateyamaria armeniaca]|uniref:Response regulator n=1 Tax=Tateyamaria armeniaca TaxID=2518930 RepID=A0ABW8UWK5_9RHOB